MPPIPIYADAPISAAAKADGITPQTAPRPTRTTEEPAKTTASSATPSSNYPAARPGAAAVPAPTPSIPAPTSSVSQPPPTRTTQSLSNSGPPAPQPGAVPKPPVPSTSSHDANNPAAPRAQALPQQLSIPPPQTSSAATSSTTTATPTSPTRRPVTLPMGPVSPTHTRPQSISSHPPGYVQNPYAAEMTSAQRASLEAVEAADRGRRSGRNSISEWIAGEGDGFGASGSGGGGGKAWDAVKGFANQAGQWAGKANDYASKKFG